ncbi:MAG TPA: lysine--tRNA ligase [Spirochaetota bacterium]|jgi:lysyl-tRNA synthetase class 2|nr:MAG: Lysine--tRNA ligase [Spirochaetes bacterium ADurb.BinA120]HNU90299.1 lysine--tRNA ligase [Spirochaetota bacterium]HPI13212.1 lysine--tRNA ligase [Spirochaetota bacterium]HPO45474.1 lysine--tRNA ligase [Spirochaetota bacterium]
MSEEINELVRQRIEKIDQYRRSGINPYPPRYRRTHTTEEARGVFREDEKPKVSIAGRLRSKRVMGKASFAHLEDQSGQMQLYARRDDMGEESYELFKSLDLGDVIGVEGFVFKTKQGEISVHVEGLTLLAKCIRPLPSVKEKDGRLFDEFADREMRYRQRYVDLIVTPKTRQDFIMRSRIITGIREYLTRRGYIEVETPMMQAIPGGAAARPFITHHNALDIDLYLRIAPELYLKRLVVGGFEKVFELNRNFRNEGISTRHNPEFTMLELYEAYADYETMMHIAEDMISKLARELLGSMSLEYQGSKIDLTPPWKRASFVDLIREYSGLDFSTIASVEEARRVAESIGVKTTDKMNLWEIAGEVFDEKVEASLVQPVFVTDYPRELSPLSKSREDNPDFVERFEIFIAGREMSNAFSELNDPFDQKARFEEQVRKREAGDDEAQMMDYDYINALEYGMPPAGGMGIGIDRLVMLFVNTASIKDTILFPLLRPEGK